MNFLLIAYWFLINCIKITRRVINCNKKKRPSSPLGVAGFYCRCFRLFGFQIFRSTDHAAGHGRTQTSAGLRAAEPIRGTRRPTHWPLILVRAPTHYNCLADYCIVFEELDFFVLCEDLPSGRFNWKKKQ